MKTVNSIILFLIWLTLLALLVNFIDPYNKHNLQAPEVSLPSYSIIENVIATAYSSDPNQTDSTPDITSTQEKCFYGGCAVSREMEKFAPMGSKIICDNREFFVNDRMSHKWKDFRIDIWMESKEDAIKYGKQRKSVVTVERRR